MMQPTKLKQGFDILQMLQILILFGTKKLLQYIYDIDIFTPVYIFAGYLLQYLRLIFATFEMRKDLRLRYILTF